MPVRSGSGQLERKCPTPASQLRPGTNAPGEWREKTTTRGWGALLREVAMTILNIFLSDDDAVDVSPTPVTTPFTTPAKTANAIDLAWALGMAPEVVTIGFPTSADLGAAYVAALAAHSASLAAIRAKRQVA